MLQQTEAEGLEPPRACARRISSAVPYQLGLRLQTSDEPGQDRRARLITKPDIGAPGFEPGTSATRTQRSTGLSHAPRTQPHPPRVCTPERTGWDSNPRGCLAPHDFQSCALSRSATRPETPTNRETPDHAAHCPAGSRPGRHPSRAGVHPQTEGVGFEPKVTEDGADGATAGPPTRALAGGGGRGIESQPTTS